MPFPTDFPFLAALSAKPDFSRAIVANPQFQDRAKEFDIREKLPRFKKVVIVSQDPPPGGDVPLGTVVDLTIAVKADLPLGDLGVLPVVAEKFGNPAAVEDAVINAPNAATLSSILAKKNEFAQLDEDDRAAFNTFIDQQGLAAADKAKVFSDIKFAFTL